jgi:hypothetical protein
MARVTILLAWVLFVLSAAAIAQDSPELDAIHLIQAIGPSEDLIRAMDVDVAVYCGGETSGQFPGQSRWGTGDDRDGFLRKYSLLGEHEWTRQIGTSSYDIVTDVAVDGAGRIYAFGITAGAFPGEANLGDVDIFVACFSDDGTNLWTRQYGTTGTENRVYGTIAGEQLVVTANTTGALPGEVFRGGLDVVVLMLDSVTGDLRGSVQFGTGKIDYPGGVGVADNAILVGGNTFGSLGSGGGVSFVRAMDLATGAELWTRQFGYDGGDQIDAVEVSGSSVFVGGRTRGAVAGSTNQGRNDVFVCRFETDGSVSWEKSFGGVSDDRLNAISNGPAGLYIAGQSDGTLFGGASLGHLAGFRGTLDASDGSVLEEFHAPVDGIEQFYAVAQTADSVLTGGRIANAALPGFEPLGSGDSVLFAHSTATGAERWADQFSANGRAADAPEAIALAPGGAIVTAGRTTGHLPGDDRPRIETGIDAMTTYHTPTGELVWGRTVRSVSSAVADEIDQALDVATDEAGIYTVGVVRGTILGETGQQDAFCRKYDFVGNSIWTRQFGGNLTADASDVLIVNGVVIVAGRTSGAIGTFTNAGGSDLFVCAFSADDGSDLWSLQIGSGQNDYAIGLGFDGTTLWVLGSVDGAVDGTAGPGGRDGIVIGLNPVNGTVGSTSLFGTPGDDAWNDAVVHDGSLFLAGSVDNDLSVERRSLDGRTVLWHSGEERLGFIDVRSLAAHARGIYLCGARPSTNGVPGGYSTSVAKLDPVTGAVSWIGGIGLSDRDSARDLVLGDGYFSVCGDASVARGTTDGFIARFSDADLATATVPSRLDALREAIDALEVDGRQGVTLHRWLKSRLRFVEARLAEDDLDPVQDALDAMGNRVQHAMEKGWADSATGSDLVDAIDALLAILSE